MYIRKQSTYSINQIYPYANVNDLRADLLTRVRVMANNQKSNHPWNNMTDMELLKSTGLYLRDYQTGNEGITLAGILLFGKDEVILSVLPHHKTDAILRIENLDRYDDRDDIRTNLIESYDRLMNFIAKHLNDKFYLDGDQRISIRDKIAREIVSNILIHREYTHAFPAKLIISKEKIYTENANKPHGFGEIDINNFIPFPKNPAIAKVFKEIGFADELGSGVRNLIKYTKLYSNGKPILEENDIFRLVVPLMSEKKKFGKEIK